MHNITILFTHYLAILFILVHFSCTLQKTPHSIEIKTYQRLDKIRDSKKNELQQFTNNVIAKAEQIRKDPLLITFFKTKHSYYKALKDSMVTPPLQESMESLKSAIKQHYINNYLLFYDILCIDTAGEIFYTIRRQRDYHTNIFAGELAQTDLSKKLRLMQTSSFIDYQFFTISNEPSAFFIEPVIVDGTHQGWFVLQFSINRINDLFTIEANLGETGEVFLVNKDHFMITDSRFDSRTSILTKKLSAENIDKKFAERSGHITVTDYRGFPVYSSFEVFNLMGSEWLLITKINTSEVITEEFLENRTTLKRSLLSKAFQSSHSVMPHPPVLPDTLLEIDMDEYRRADSNEVLYTHGISTCTGFSVCFPGRFAYMAHISPFDIIYGNSKTDLTANILSKIKKYEIFPHEKPFLQFSIIATDKNAAQKIIQTLLDDGFFLSQIKVAYNPDVDYSNFLLDTRSGNATVIWRNSGIDGLRKSESFSEIKCLEEILYNPS